MIWLVALMLILNIVIFKKYIDEQIWLEREHLKQKRHDELYRKFFGEEFKDED